MAKSSGILGKFYDNGLHLIFSMALHNILKYGGNFFLQITHLKLERGKK